VVPYAVTLRLDAAAAVRVELMWRALADQGGDDDALRLGYAPHVTLAVLPDTAPAEAVEDAVFRVARTWDELPVVLAGLGVFPGTPPVIWAAPVVTERLLARHGTLHAALAPFPVHPHYRPEAWVPHVTLSQQGRSPAGRAVERAASAWDGPIKGRLDRLDLVEFLPVNVLRSAALRPSG
jgi:2'-5' RNA ligase